MADTVRHILPNELTLELTAAKGEKQGLGLWTLGLAGARWAASGEGRAAVSEKRVLELGSGVGLAGLACGASASEVTLTDYDDEVLGLLRCHVELNRPRLRQGVIFRVAKLDWDAPAPEPEPEPEPELGQLAEPEGVLGSPARRFDVVLGADVCYSGMSQVPSLFDDSSDDDSPSSPDDGAAADPSQRHAWENSANVAQTLAWCMAQPHGVAHLFVHEGRSPDEVARFISRADELGMVTVREPLSPELLGQGSADSVAGEGAVLHDYTLEQGLVRLVVRWREPNKAIKS